MNDESKCPVHRGGRARTNAHWWPEQLDLSLLHQHSALSDPMVEGFDYKAEFETLDIVTEWNQLLVALDRLTSRIENSPLLTSY